MPRRAMLNALSLSAIAVFAGLGLATSAAAQDLEIQLDREQMTTFARTHIAINDARDEFHGAVARVHDREGRIRAREDVEATIESILEEAEMTREEYDQITLLISLDGELRIMFEEVMIELEEEGTAR